jgi:hypothetical protein
VKDSIETNKKKEDRMNSTQKAQKLQQAWKRQLALRQKSQQKYREALRLYRPKHHNDDYARTEMIENEGDLLDAKADLLWTRAVMDIYGDVKIEWVNDREVTLTVGKAQMVLDVSDCIVEGVTYKYEQ